MVEVSRESKTDRVMELFLRAMKGESLSAIKLSAEYNVSPRSITRDINRLKNFLYEHKEETGYAELVYNNASHCYQLKMDSLLSNSELMIIAKILIGSRALNTTDLLSLIKKLKMHTSITDREKLELLLSKELYHYHEIGADCKSIVDNVWKITECIENKDIITISYYKMNRSLVSRKIKPVAIMFSEYYFYLIAYKCDAEDADTPYYFRIDRITDTIIHREKYTLTKSQSLDEGLIREKSQFMWPGKARKIRFEFSGPSVQAILDRIPTAKIVDIKNSTYIIDAEVYGSGIKMFLLSQGAWVKVVAPSEFVEEIKEEIIKMQAHYILS